MVPAAKESSQGIKGVMVPAAKTTEMPKIERSKAPLLLEVRDEETNETRNKNRRTRRNVPHRMDSKDGHTEPAVLPLLLS